jgi:large subunit ribosomal protein L22
MSTVEATGVEIRSTAKYVHVSPRKARLVIDHIRGRSVPEARTVLAFTTRAAAIEIEKVLSSAVANAETHPDLRWDGDDLVVSAAYVDEGPTLKRWRPRARGRAARINKRTCHITIALTLPEKPAAASGPGSSAEQSKRRRGSSSGGATPARSRRGKREAVAS